MTSRRTSARFTAGPPRRCSAASASRSPRRSSPSPSSSGTPAPRRRCSAPSRPSAPTSPLPTSRTSTSVPRSGRAGRCTRRRCMRSTLPRRSGLDEDDVGGGVVGRRRRDRRGPAGVLPPHDRAQATPGRTFAHPAHRHGHAAVLARGPWQPATSGLPLQLHPSLDADGSVSGTAVELYLGLWKRLGPERLDFSGRRRTHPVRRPDHALSRARLGLELPDRAR